MAERVAHISPTASLTPSLFDFIAQETLNNLLYPVAKKVTSVFAPDTVLNNFTNIYYGFSLGLQFLFLKTSGATFSEKFYGLKRIPSNHPKVEKIGGKTIFLSLIAEVFLPYIKMKLNEATEKLSNNNQNKNKELKNLLNISTTALEMTTQILGLIHYVRYLSGATVFASPMLRIAGVKLMYSDEASQKVNSSTLKNFLVNVLPTSIGVIVFFVQFLQWWETNKTTITSTQNVPPPAVSKNVVVTSGGKCPICHKNRYIDTVLPISGYVFCFGCISSYLLKHQKCPITELPATVDNLIHVFSPN